MKSQPASLVLTEDRLRAFMKCPAFFHFGGTTQIPLRTAVLEFVYIRMILEIMRNPDFEYKFFLNATLAKTPRQLKLAEHLEPVEIKEYMRHAAINTDEIFRILNPQRYIPAFGPFEYPIKVSHVVFKPRIAALLATNINNYSARVERDRHRILHAVTFSPFSSPRDMENDIVQRIKVMSLANASPIRASHDSSDIKLHIFSAGTKTGELSYTSIEWNSERDGSGWGQYLEAPIKLMESGYDYPINPCLYSCPYKNICAPDPAREPIQLENE